MELKECAICGKELHRLETLGGIKICQKCVGMKENESLAAQFNESEMIDNMTKEERLRF